jgi:catechol 2,3-dioxygenase-like lactoylglutathione lyase family enzyme
METGDLPTGLTLDHVALVTADLEASREAYETLGFTLTRVSSHKGRITPDGPVVAWGSGNHCAMFRRGYFEILGLTDPNLYHEPFREALSRFHGVSMVALGCESAEAFYERSKSGSAPLVPPVEVRRDIPSGETTREALFRIVRLEPGAFPELELLFIEQATRSLLWQKPLLEHPNGVIGLSGLSLCSDAPEETAARFERCTGLGGAAKDGSPHFVLDGSYVAMTSPENIMSRFRGAVLPAVPSVGVVELSVEDVDATKRFLEGAGVTPHASKDGIWVRPERTGGVILEFKS